MTIGKAAQHAGVNVETIRFYERKGLIEQPAKPDRSVRCYSHALVQRVRFIREAQQLGFALREVGELLALRVDPSADCSQVRLQAIAKRREVHDKIGRLQQIGAALDVLIADCPGCGALQSCSIIEALEYRSDGVPDNSAIDRNEPPIGTDEPHMKTVTIKIEGMHCNGCAQTIKALIQKEPGVRMAEVSYKDGEARVMYDLHAISEERLAKVIAKPGYRVIGQS